MSFLRLSKEPKKNQIRSEPVTSEASLERVRPINQNTIRCFLNRRSFLWKVLLPKKISRSKNIYFKYHFHFHKVLKSNTTKPSTSCSFLSRSFSSNLRVISRKQHLGLWVTINMEGFRLVKVGLLVIRTSAGAVMVLPEGKSDKEHR